MELQGVDDPPVVKPCMNWYNTVSTPETAHKFFFVTINSCIYDVMVVEMYCEVLISKPLSSAAPV